MRIRVAELAIQAIKDAKMVKWKDNQCSYQDSIMIYKRPEVVSISPHMQHEVFQITETHPDLFIRLLKAPATSIAMFKITTCSGALTVGEHSHIFLPSINMEPRHKALHPMPVSLASIFRPSSTESAISELHWTGPSRTLSPRGPSVGPENAELPTP